MPSQDVMALQITPGSAGVGVLDRTIELAFTQLRLGKQASPEVVEQVVELVATGELDAAIRSSAPPVEPVVIKRRFDEQQEFSHAAWKKRHGLDG